MQDPAPIPEAVAPPDGLSVPLRVMRETVERGDTRPLHWRLEMLSRLEALLDSSEAAMADALMADLGRPPLEVALETGTLRQELRHTRRHLGGWMRPRSRPTPPWAWPAQARVQPQPLGCVLIIGAWNYPFELCLHPLLHALAAGNTAVVKPSELAPASAALLADRLRRHFPPEVVQVVLGDGAVASRLLEQRFDHILFTGGQRTGRLVMAAAARHLTPVTLELGGQNPAIVLADADPAIAARRLVWGRALNGGQTCLAPNHLLVAAEGRTPLLEAIATETRRLYGSDPLTSPDLARIVNGARFAHLEALLAGARQRSQVLLGGGSDATTLRIEPTLVAVDDPDHDPVMQEELFAPILPVLTVADLTEALGRVRRGPSPLVIYLFSGDPKARRQVLDTSTSGSVVCNDVVVQGAMAPLPFGGIGSSGMGAYHGETGFLTFSHRRGVLSRPLWPDPPFRYPPYAGKVGLIRRLMG